MCDFDINPIENTLREWLRNNIMVFTYRKVNGEIRHAIGTRNLALATTYTGESIPTPKGKEQPNSYYDVERKGWRSWKDGSVISIDGINPTGMVCGFLNTNPNLKQTEETPVQNSVTEPVGFVHPPKEEVRKEMGKVYEDIDLPTGKGFARLAESIGLGGGMPMGGGEEIPVGGFGGGKEEKPIVVGIPARQPNGGGMPMGGGKVGTPTNIGHGMALPISGVGGKEMSIDDFAKLVAKYVVAELAERLTK